MTTPLARTDIVEIPTPGDYRLDTQDCVISFTIRHLLGLARVRGTMQLRDGHIQLADPIPGSSVRATISAASFDTGVPARDTAVQSGRYLDADTHPHFTFTSTRVEQADGHWLVRGSLTVRGRTHPVDLHVDQVRPDGPRLRVRASGRVDRYLFGITALKAFIGRHLTVRLDLTATRT